MQKIFMSGMVFMMMLLMLICPKVCIEGASSGLLLWFQKVLPSLLPFIILINLLCSLGIIFKCSRLLNPITQKLFHLSGNGLIIFLLGLISGYPMGAKLAKNLLEEGQITYEEAQKSLCYSCNCGPLFIIGTVGTLMLQDTNIGYFLLVVHILSAFIMLILSRFYTIPQNSTHVLHNNNSSSLSFSTAFTSAVQNGMDTIVYVGGYIIFFSVISNLLAHSSLYTSLTQFFGNLVGVSPTLIHSFLLSSLEFSSGSARLTSLLPLNTTLLALLSAVIAFGGFCVCFQSQHVLQGTHLSLKPYIYSKLLQALLAYVLTFILYPIWNPALALNFSFKWYLLLGIVLIWIIFLFKTLSPHRVTLKTHSILS